MPSKSAQLAIGLGFLLGTWLLVDGFQTLITGHPLLVAGHPGPWVAWGATAALAGALWMLLGNLYLFQNRSANWKAFTILVVLSSWSAGWAVLILVAQLALLLTPSARRSLRH